MVRGQARLRLPPHRQMVAGLSRCAPLSVAGAVCGGRLPAAQGFEVAVGATALVVGLRVVVGATEDVCHDGGDAVVHLTFVGADVIDLVASYLEGGGLVAPLLLE